MYISGLNFIYMLRFFPTFFYSGGSFFDIALRRVSSDFDVFFYSAIIDPEVE